MTEALVPKDPKVKTSKKKYSRPSRLFKRQIAKARSEHIAKIGEKLESYPSGTHEFWALVNWQLYPAFASVIMHRK